MTKTPKSRLLAGAAALALGAGALNGCKDYLADAAQPQGTLDAGTLANAAGVEASLISAYRALDCTTATRANWGCAASDWVFGSVTSDDAYKGSEASDQPAINDLEAYHWGTGDAESYLNVKWRQEYEGVSRANATLRALDAIPQGGILPADAQSIRGESIFLRAHYHFEAWLVFGNIPYYRAADQAAGQDFRKANEPSAQVVTDILTDLDSAITLLSTTPRGGQVGRVTQWTARAFKGRVQAYAGQWQNALTTLRQVQASGPYALESSYEKVWTGFPALQNGKETILAYQASANDGETDGANANYGQRLSFPHSGSPFGCCGFHQPSQTLVNYFAVDAAGLPVPVTSPDPAVWDANSTNFVAGSATAVDPRLDWTVGRDGVPYKDWAPHAPGWIRSPSYGGVYSPKKWIHEKASGAQSTVGWNAQQLNSVNVHIFRYADLLLLLAEAEIEAGTLDNARVIVDSIRARASRSAQGCGGDAGVVALYASCAGDTRLAVPINDPSIKWATYRIGLYPAGSPQFASQAAAREAVHAERMLELGMEGHRFFDLRRWGVLQSTMNTYLGIEKSRRLYLTGAEALTARHNLYPIPAEQIELSRVGSESRLQQNTGW